MDDGSGEVARVVTKVVAPVVVAAGVLAVAAAAAPVEGGKFPLDRLAVTGSSVAPLSTTIESNPVADSL